MVSKSEAAMKIGPKTPIEPTQLLAQVPRRDWQAPRDKIRLALIDDRRLTRACVSQLLERNAEEFVVVSFSEPAEFVNGLDARCEDVDLILMHVGAAIVGEGCGHQIHELKCALPDTPIVVLSDGDEATSIVEAFRCGARGFVPTSLSPPVAIEALRLVSAGGTFAPTDPLLAAIDTSAAPCSNPRMGNEELARRVGFTPRQLEVLAFLQRGKSNKVIASGLDMQESTVKVHVRHIMKKLKATNRTHAALLAYRMTQGLGVSECSGGRDVEAHAERHPQGVVRSVVSEADPR